ncbi:aminotransferase class V-fold PLP-dependent enzyme [Stenotrophomonas sp. WHRI 8082]|uniref:aminotransferase class V-fold PLP-dependent enzyme n=1 Tax=Stenotrophomonas sp. WHRI 8082 TaxID=3162571 RepID=UPI0035576815
MRIIEETPAKTATVSFLIDGTNAHGLATLLGLEGMAMRSCAHPLLQYDCVLATCRVSLAPWNTHEEIRGS